MGKLRVSRIENASTTDGGIDIDTSGHVQVDGLQMPTAGPLTNRNLIINGAMNVAQRGTSVLGTGFCVDRFQISATGLDQCAFTQNQSSTAPAGYAKSLQLDITAAETSLDADEQLQCLYRFEGQDLQQLEHGTASAKSITLSFWVKSNLTGTYAVSFFKNDSSRTYTANYSINNIDTWEQKFLTIPGDTSGAIPSNTDNELSIHFFLAAGTDRTTGSSTLNQWGAFSLDSFASGQTVNMCSSTSNEWFITGVQLEVGEKATPFEHRSYGDELAKCQRYYQAFFGVTNGLTFIARFNSPTAGNSTGTTISLHQSMRAAPTVARVGNFTVLNSGQPSLFSTTELVNLSNSSTTTGDSFFYASSSAVGFTASAEL